MAQPIFQPELWQVACDAASDTVAGMIRNFIKEEENRLLGRRRGYTEWISVRRPWRKRGLARALLARSLELHREHGMTDAALRVDAENPNGALRLYESIGFRTTVSNIVYHKPLPAQ